MLARRIIVHKTRQDNEIIIKTPNVNLYVPLYALLGDEAELMIDKYNFMELIQLEDLVSNT